MRPYYQDEFATIYLGDARDVLEPLNLSGIEADVVVTDPVWPNSVPELAGADDPAGLFRQVMTRLPRSVVRLVIQLGCDSDPRFLQGVPERFPFFRTCWLEYVRPHYKGRLLYTSDIAYVFGTPPASRVGGRVMPGRFIQTDAQKRFPDHPCPRQPQHVAWLLGFFAPTGTVLDPFMGSGTTLIEAKRRRQKAVGIEISEPYCEAAASRLEAIRQESFGLEETKEGASA